MARKVEVVAVQSDNDLKLRFKMLRIAVDCEYSEINFSISRNRPVMTCCYQSFVDVYINLKKSLAQIDGSRFPVSELET